MILTYGITPCTLQWIHTDLDNKYMYMYIYKCLPLFFLVDYVAEIFETLMTTPRDTLRFVADELKQDVPAPLHSMLEKESREEAVNKYQARKQKETVIVPPTCTGMSKGLVVQSI